MAKISKVDVIERLIGNRRPINPISKKFPELEAFSFKDEDILDLIVFILQRRKNDSETDNG